MNKNGYTLVELIILIFMVLVFAAIAGGLVCLVKGCNYVKDNGVKSVANQVWNGTNQQVITK